MHGTDAHTCWTVVRLPFFNFVRKPIQKSQKYNKTIEIVNLRKSFFLFFSSQLNKVAFILFIYISEIVKKQWGEYENDILNPVFVCGDFFLFF